MTITALVIEYRYKGPPALVTILPAFWLLAPGSFGLVSVTGMAADGMGSAGQHPALAFHPHRYRHGCLIGAFFTAECCTCAKRAFGGTNHRCPLVLWVGMMKRRTNEKAAFT
jgi:hypothetical protein